MTGFINVDKQSGVSSAREVAIIKRLTSTPCGHMGTLDPMATGVLPVAIGNAARLFNLFLSKTKTYIAELTFGIQTDTLDITGSVIARGEIIPQYEDIISVLPRFIGKINQLPPKYSAKNVGGRRAYELARSGEDFQLKPRQVEIFGIEALEKTSENSVKLKIECGGGTYIRSLARDIGSELSAYCTLSSLQRIQSGAFGIENAVQTSLLTKDNIADYIIPTESVLSFPEIYPTGAAAKKLFNGVAVQSDLSDGTYKIYNENGLFYGLAEVKNNVLKVGVKLC